MDEDCRNINEDENYGENIKAYSCVVKSIQSYVNEDMDSYYHICMNEFKKTREIENKKNYFTFKFFNGFLIKHFKTFFLNNGFSTNEYHSIFNNSIDDLINDGKRKLISIDINDEELENFIQNITSNNKINDTNDLLLDQKINQLMDTTKIQFTKCIVSKTIQSILKLLKHFNIIPESSVIRNNNGNYGVDFLKSLPYAKTQIMHTDYKNFKDNNDNEINNFIGASVIINFEDVPFTICLVEANKTISVTVYPQCFIFFYGNVEHCGASNNTSFDINKIFFFIDKDVNYRRKKNVFDSVFFTSNDEIKNKLIDDNNNNLDLSTNNITTNNGRNDADQNFNTPSNIIVDNTSIITDNNSNNTTTITDNNSNNTTIANENSSTRVSKRLKSVKSNYNETNALISNNYKKQKTIEFKTIINQLDHYATTSKKYNIKTFEVRNHKNLKKIEALKNKYIICNSTIKKLKNDNRLIKKEFKKKVKELSKICDDLREELQQTKQKLNDLDKNISVNNRLNFDECSNVNQVVDNIKEYESSNNSDEEYSFSNNNTILKTDESLKETESIINTLTQKQRNGQEGWKKTFKELSELTRKYNTLIKEESSDDDLL